MKEYVIKKYDYEDYVAVENMSPDETINILEHIKRGYIPDYNFTGNEDDLERYKLHVAMNKAINIIRSLHVKKQHNEY